MKAADETVVSDPDVAPLTRRDRTEAQLLAAKVECGDMLTRRQRERLCNLVFRYEIALQSVGYTNA